MVGATVEVVVGATLDEDDDGTTVELVVGATVEEDDDEVDDVGAAVDVEVDDGAAVVDAPATVVVGDGLRITSAMS